MRLEVQLGEVDTCPNGVSDLLLSRVHSYDELRKPRVLERVGASDIGRVAVGGCASVEQE